MKLTLSNISHFDFFDQLEKYLAEIKTLIDNETMPTEEYLGTAIGLISNVKDHIENHVKPNADDVISLLDDWKRRVSEKFYIDYDLAVPSEISLEKERLVKFKNTLKVAIGYVSVTNSLIDPEAETIIETINEKTDFALLKLYDLFGDEFYSIAQIFDLNGISYRDRETREIAEELSRKGYAILNSRYGDSDLIKISVKGASYIERKNKQQKSTKAKNEMDKKLDNIIEHLTKLGYGQEILFEEIEELRSLQVKLSKNRGVNCLKASL